MKESPKRRDYNQYFNVLAVSVGDIYNCDDFLNRFYRAKSQEIKKMFFSFSEEAGRILTEKFCDNATDTKDVKMDNLEKKAS